MSIKDRHCLESIIDSIDRILEYSSECNSADELNNDRRSFDATMMNFVVIGEMVAKLSEAFRNDHPNIEWQKIKGFRNILAHDYFGIDAEEVWQIIENQIPVLKSDIQKIISRISTG